MCDDAVVSRTEPTTASFICTQKYPHEGNAAELWLSVRFLMPEMWLCFDAPEMKWRNIPARKGNLHPPAARGGADM